MLVTPLLGGRRPCTGSWVLSGNVPAQLGGGTSTVASTAPQWPTLRLLPAPPDPRLHHGGVPPNRPQLLIGCAFLRGQAGEAGAQLLW